MFANFGKCGDQMSSPTRRSIAYLMSKCKLRGNITLFLAKRFTLNKIHLRPKFWLFDFYKEYLVIKL